MFWFSAEKQPSAYFEFFNRIDPQRTLEEITLTAENGHEQAIEYLRSAKRSIDLD